MAGPRSYEAIWYCGSKARAPLDRVGCADDAPAQAADPLGLGSVPAQRVCEPLLAAVSEIPRDRLEQEPGANMRTSRGLSPVEGLELVDAQVEHRAQPRGILPARQRLVKGPVERDQSRMRSARATSLASSGPSVTPTRSPIPWPGRQ